MKIRGTGVAAAVGMMFVSAVFFGCAAPEKVIDDSLKTGGDVAKGVADTTGNVVEGAAVTAGSAVTGVTTGETATGIGQTIDGAGKEFFKRRDVDVAGQDVQVDMSQDKKIKVEF